MVILAVVSTMLVTIWISLQRSADFSEQKNSAAATGRGVLDRVSSELRAAQPCAASTATPFKVTLASPYVCDGYDCTFYTPYNNALAATQSGTDGQEQARLTSIYLDTSGTSPGKKLMMVIDSNSNGSFGAGDQTITLASNVVNTAASVNRPIFTYVLGNSGTYTTTTSLNAGNATAVVAVNIEIVVDTNMLAKPTYVDLVSTVRPRNATAN